MSRLDSWLAAAPDALAQPAPKHSATACLVVARMLMDPVFAESVMTGPVEERLSSEVRALQRHPGRGVAEQVGIAPWASARHLSSIGRAGQRPLRYLWYPVLGRRGPVFDRLARAARDSRPLLVYVGPLMQPHDVRLVVEGDDHALRCFNPGAGAVQPWARSAFVKGQLDLATQGRPSYMVVPTGRRAAH